MAQNTTITIPAGTWVQLSDNDIDSITFQNIGLSVVVVKATTTDTAPENTNGALRYEPKEGEKNAFLVDLFPGVEGADRLYAFSAGGTEMVVSHA
jgi:hypothetical protein